MLPKITENLLAGATADPAKPVEGSTREFTVRCRIPFSLPCGHIQRSKSQEEGQPLRVRAVGMGPGEGMDLGSEDEDGSMDLENVVASSTSVDWYGTEMSVRALEQMATSMKVNPDICVRSHWMSEWEDVLGRCKDARVVQAQVMKPYDPNEQGHALVLGIELYAECEPADRLRRAIDREQKVGVSIGGWFTEVRFIYKVDAEGKRITDEWGWEILERIIVEAVELDHLAVTRTPANPDAWIKTLRTKLHEATQAVSVLTSIPEPVSTSEIHHDQERGASPFRDLPTAPEDTAWTWTADDQNEILGDPPDWARYKRANFWFDPEKPEVKAGYKLGFAHMIDGTLTAIWRGVSAAMGALNGARGGVDIPSEDREAVYRHIGRYYEKFGKDQPELADLSVSPPEQPAEELPATRGTDLSTEPPQSTDPSPTTLDRAQESGHDTDQTASRENAEQGGGGAGPAERATENPAGATMTIDPAALEAMFDKHLKPLGERLDALEKGTEDRSGGRRVPRTRSADAPKPDGIKAIVNLAEGDDESLGQVFRTITERGTPCIFDADNAQDPKVSKSTAKDDLATVLDSMDRRTIYNHWLEGDQDFVVPPPVRKRSVGNVHNLQKLTPQQQAWVERSLNVSGAGTILVQTMINRTVEMEVLRDLGVWSTLPRRPGQGPGAYINRRAPNTTLAAWVSDTADLDSYEGTGTYTQYTKAYMTLATRGKVTRKLRATGRSYGDTLALELEGKSEDFATMAERGFLTGNSGADANSVDGLLTQGNAAGSSQIVAQTSAASGASLTLAKLDAAIDRVRGNANRSDLRIYGSLAGLRQVNAALQAQQRFNDVISINGGFRVRTYDDIPLIPSTEMPNAILWGGTSITAMSGGATTALVIVNTRSVWIEELTPVTVEPLAKKSSQYDEFDIYWDGALVLANRKGIALLGGVAPGAEAE